MKARLHTQSFFSALLLSAAFGALAAAPATLEPGEWKTTVQTDMSNANIPGLPAGIKLPTKPAMTYNWCNKPQPGKDMGQTIADTANRNNPGQKCEMLENKTSGNNVHYKMRCNGPQGEATITGDFTAENKRFSGKTHLQMNSPMGPMQMSSNINGEYVGPCKAAAK